MEALKEFMEPLMKPMGIVGIVGQCMFFCRFLVQWVVSEKRGESTIPIVFWYLSLVGGVLTFIYAFWRRDPVFTGGQALGIFVYSRNLILIYRKRREQVPKTMPGE